MACSPLQPCRSPPRLRSRVTQEGRPTHGLRSSSSRRRRCRVQVRACLLRGRVASQRCTAAALSCCGRFVVASECVRAHNVRLGLDAYLGSISGLRRNGWCYSILLGPRCTRRNIEAAICSCWQQLRWSPRVCFGRWGPYWRQRASSSTAEPSCWHDGDARADDAADVECARWWWPISCPTDREHGRQRASSSTAEPSCWHDGDARADDAAGAIFPAALVGSTGSLGPTVPRRMTGHG